MNDEQHQAMLDLYQANMARIRGFIEGIGPHQWNMATPCEEWSVRDLTGHIVGGMLMFGTVAGGGELPEGDPEVDLLGDDALAAYDQACGVARAGFASPGVADRTVVLPIGAIPGRAALAVALADLTVHGWDLATAIGRGGDIPKEYVEQAEATLRPVIDPDLKAPWRSHPGLRSGGDGARHRHPDRAARRLHGTKAMIPGEASAHTARRTTMSTTTNEQLIHALVGAFGRGDLDTVASCFAADAEWHLPGRGILAGTYHGPDEIVGFLARAHQLSGGTLSLDVLDVLASDNGAAHVQRVTAFNAGRTLDCVEVLAHEIHDGKIVKTFHRPDSHAIDEFFAA